MSASRPNLLVILADQLRRQALSCYGDPNSFTPHIDQLAREGVRCTQACSSFPVCVPFRFTFMTGQQAHTRGMPSIGYRMSPAERTLADVWNEAGYHTVYLGKWHLYGGGHGILPDYDSVTTNRLPVPREHQGRWRKWFGFELCNSHFNTCYFEDDDPTPRKLNGYQTDGMFDLAMGYLKNRAQNGTPFACVLSVEPPHPPYEAPEDLTQAWLQKALVEDPNFMIPCSDLDRFDGNANLLPPSRKEDALRSEKLYYAMVEDLDRNVGRMIRHLEETGLRKNTIVVLMADHGHCGYRHCWQQKGMPFEESIGIPLIISNPQGKDRWGTTFEEVMGTEDLFPTLLGLTNVDAGSTPGLDMSPGMKGDSVDTGREGILIENTFIIRPDLPRFDKGWRGLRTNTCKYVLEGGIKEGATPWQFYDLVKDPYEMNNRVHCPDEEERIRGYHGKLLERLRESGDDFPVAPAFGFPSQGMPHPPNGIRDR